MSENEDAIFAPPERCDVCSSPRVRLATNREIHGPKAHNPDARVYHCLKCKAVVGTVPGTDRPTGLMANAYLASLRTRAHLQFDPIWQFGKMSRSKAYKLLREELGLTEEEGHIGVMSEELLVRVIAFSRNYLSEEAAIQRRRQDKKYERQLKRNERRDSLEAYKRGAKRYY